MANVPESGSLAGRPGPRSHPDSPGHAGKIVEIFTDSQYLRRGVTEWLPQWRHNGWQTKEKKPVKNADLWKQLDSAAQGHQVQWFWLKGHAGHPENERADELACRGAEEAAAQAVDNEWGPGASDIYGSLLSQAADEPGG